MDLLYEALEFPVLRSPPGWRATEPGVIPALGDKKQATHKGHRVLGLVGFHEPEDLGGMDSVSRANQAAAFARISLSVLSPYMCNNMKKLCTSVSKKVLKRKKEVHVIYYMTINPYKKYFVSTIWIKREGFKKSRISTDRTSIKGLSLIHI